MTRPPVCRRRIEPLDWSHYVVLEAQALRELMPEAELWDVPSPHQNGANTLEQILKFKAKLAP